MGMSKVQIVEKLTALGIQFDPEAKTADLIALLPKEKPLIDQLQDKIQADYSKPVNPDLQRNMRKALEKLEELKIAIAACEKNKKRTK